MKTYKVTYKSKLNGELHTRPFTTKEKAKFFINSHLKGNRFYKNRRLKRIKGE